MPIFALAVLMFACGSAAGWLCGYRRPSPRAGSLVALVPLVGLLVGSLYPCAEPRLLPMTGPVLFYCGAPFALCYQLQVFRKMSRVSLVSKVALSVDVAMVVFALVNLAVLAAER